MSPIPKSPRRRARQWIRQGSARADTVSRFAAIRLGFILNNTTRRLLNQQRELLTRNGRQIVEARPQPSAALRCSSGWRSMNAATLDWKGRRRFIVRATRWPCSQGCASICAMSHRSAQRAKGCIACHRHQHLEHGSLHDPGRRPVAAAPVMAAGEHEAQLTVTRPFQHIFPFTPRALLRLIAHRRRSDFWTGIGRSSSPPSGTSLDTDPPRPSRVRAPPPRPLPPQPRLDFRRWVRKHARPAGPGLYGVHLRSVTRFASRSTIN